MAEIISTTLANAVLDEIVTLMADGIIVIYSGSQPATADATEGAAVALCEITDGGGAFSGGSPTNGINLVRSGQTLIITGTESWEGVADATGTAGWFRFYDNSYTLGADTGSSRFDGRISTSGAEINLNTTALVEDGPVTITSFVFTLPTS